MELATHTPFVPQGVPPVGARGFALARGRNRIGFVQIQNEKTFADFASEGLFRFG